MRSEGHIPPETTSGGRRCAYPYRRQPPYTNSDKYAALSKTTVKKTRKVSMFLVNHPDKHIIACRIENSPIADPRFASQKVSVQQKINQLFFEHFKGTYQTENVEEGEIAVITFTYPTLS